MMPQLHQLTRYHVSQQTLKRN